MRNNYKRICDILNTDTRFISSEGELLKNKIVECANKMDTALISLLYKNDFTKSMFFVDADGIAVFDKVKFGWVIESEDFLPDSYTHFKNNILLTDGSGNSIKKCNDVVLEFPHKDCILEMDSTSEDEERKEVFLNETIMKNEVDCLLSPKCLVNAVKHSQEGSKTITEINDKDNLIIKGNNLLVLHSLLPRYKGQIKLMYWDILYNTQNDIIPYNDNFKHSTWLVMMKNRLEIAKYLLKEDGVICLQCDKNEDAYLKVLCDEVFGRENFVNHICIKSSSASGTKTAHKEKTVIKLTDTLLIYKKGGELKINPAYERKQKWDSHYSVWIEEENGILIEKSLISKLKEMKIVGQDVNFNTLSVDDRNFKNFYLKYANQIGRWSSHKVAEAKKYGQEHPNTVFSFEDKGIFKGSNQFSPLSSVIKPVTVGNREELDISLLLCDIWTDIDFNNTQNEGNNSLPAGKKPEMLIKRIIGMFSNEGDIVLDAYLGSGTTAAVAHKLGRQYIGIEQLDKHYSMAVNRVVEVVNGEQTGISRTVNWNGGGSFISCRLADNSQNVIDKIMESNSEDELKEIYQELKLSDFVLYRVDINKMSEHESSFNGLSMDDKKKFLVGIIDKNTLYVNYSDIEDFHYDLLEEDKKFTKNFYEGGE